MKYIRTKDGRIIDVSNMQEYETDDENNKRVFDGYGLDDDSIYYPTEDIIKQADTIEELCDFCEIEDVDNFYEIYDLTREEYPEDIIKEYLIDDSFITSIFVGLKTNEGLIYKAKMKGVLPNGEIDWELL